MKKIKFEIVYFLLLLFALESCKTLNTNLSIHKQELPTSYNTITDSITVAQIKWREYFADTNLIKLIDTAIINNFDLQIALQRIQTARSGIKFSTGELLPKLDANVYAGSTRYPKYTQEYAGNVTTQIPGDATKVVPNPYNDFFIGLNSSWEIDIWGKLRNQRKSAIANYLASVEGKNFVLSNLVSDVAVSYYELLALDNDLEIIGQTIQKQQEALDVIKFHKKAGKTNELAVQQFQAQLLRLQISEKETQQQIIETKNKINFLLGRFPQAIERDKQSLFQSVPHQISSGIPSQLLENRPDIREAEYQVQASKFNLKMAKASFFPNINLSAALGFQAFNPHFLFSTPASIGYSVLGGLVAPLVNRNGLKLQFNTAKTNQLTAMYNYQKTILNAYVEVVNELSNIQNLQEINLLKKQQSKILKQTVEASTDLYKTAKANYLEVLFAQQNSLQTELELIHTTKRQRISMITIYKALGGGWK